MAEKARKDGLLSLETGLNDIESVFLRNGVELAINERDSSRLRTFLSMDLNNISTRHIGAQEIILYMAAYAPAFGMLGTVLGLIIMMNKFQMSGETTSIDFNVADFSERLGIYKNPDELLSISLGSAETTLLKLTSAYCSFVNGGKKIKPILIDRIQDSEGNTIISNETRKCKNCDKISYLSNNIPEISTDNLEQIMSPQTAYQITSMLEGVIKRGTGKKLKNLNLDIAGKTGTTNKNTDTWFVGFTSKLVIGVYVGMDEPQPLGKYETGSRTAMPIFKEFIQKAVKKKDTRPFKVSENITMVMIDPKTGMKANFTSKETIIEAFKKDSIENNFQLKKDINDRFNKKNILQFY